jgi:lipid-binding SYLF domain-containing protein
MRVAQASAGARIGAAQNEMLLVFPTEQSLTDFVEKGWDGSGTGGGSGAGTGGTSIYMLTKNGVQGGGGVEGAKYWKDKALN